MDCLAWPLECRHPHMETPALTGKVRTSFQGPNNPEVHKIKDTGQ